MIFHTLYCQIKLKCQPLASCIFNFKRTVKKELFESGLLEHASGYQPVYQINQTIKFTVLS